MAADTGGEIKRRSRRPAGGAIAATGACRQFSPLCGIRRCGKKLSDLAFDEAAEMRWRAKAGGSRRHFLLEPLMGQGWLREIIGTRWGNTPWPSHNFPSTVTL